MNELPRRQIEQSEPSSQEDLPQRRVQPSAQEHSAEPEPTDATALPQADRAELMEHLGRVSQAIKTIE